MRVVGVGAVEATTAEEASDMADIVATIIGLAILIGLVRAFIYVIDSLGELRSGQKEIKEQPERIERRG